jgi:hypothetical protein
MTAATLTMTIREDDLQAHIEDDLIITVTRDGKRVHLRWNELTYAEQIKHCPRNRAGYLLPPPIPTPTITISWLPMR